MRILVFALANLAYLFSLVWVLDLVRWALTGEPPAKVVEAWQQVLR